MSTDTILLILAVIGPLIGVVGIAIAIRSRRRKKPRWAIRTTNLFQGGFSQLPDLAVTYQGQSVDNLSVSRIAFWNAGNETIKGDDLTRGELELAGLSDEVKIMSAKTVTTTEEDNRIDFGASASTGTAKLAFAYLDKNDGAVFHVVHTGTSSADLTLKGKIMGAREVQLIRRLRVPVQRSWRDTANVYISLLRYSIALAILLVPISIWRGRPFSPIELGLWALAISFGGPALVIFWFLVGILINDLLYTPLPASLNEPFFETPGYTLQKIVRREPL